MSPDLGHAQTAGNWVISSPPKSANTAPWRKIHLDFHNSKYVRSVGEEFDASEFVQMLRSGEVDSIVLFAKDMHGYCYYPSRLGPVHPGLARDLLGEQVAACKAAGIQTYAYYCTLWDHCWADIHPEWLSIRQDGTNYLPAPGETYGWTALCASNEELVASIERHIEEILGGYEVEGIWFDMPVPRDGECFCRNCLKGITREGDDPYDTSVQRHFQHRLHRTFLTRLYKKSRSVRPECQVDFNNQVAFGLGERIAEMDSVDIEALPTAQWGYDFFPVAARYVRTFAATAYGMTGRFLQGWGDFGGLKSSNQLKAETFVILALGARCDIGDQMPPSGKLDRAVYESIGVAYREVKRLRPYLEGAQTVAEAAVLVSGLALDSPATDSTSGLVKALAELSLQFDVVELRGDWRRYGLVILEGDSVTEQDYGRLREYLDSGGRAIFVGPISEETADFLALKDFGKCGYNPSFALMPGEGSIYPFAIYGESSSWQETGETLSREGVPEFQRSPDHFTSHAQSPFARESGKANTSLCGSFACIGFPIGRLYRETGYWIYRDILDLCIDGLHKGRLVKTDSPAIQVTIGVNGGKVLAHVFDSAIGRPGPNHPPYYEPAPPRADVKIRLRIGVVDSVRAVMAGLELPFVLRDEGWSEIILPRLDTYELLVIPNSV